MQYFHADKLLRENRLNALADVINYIIEVNPYGGIKQLYWNLEASFNLPILIAASYVVKSLCETEKYKKILFATRDGVHWMRIYHRLFDEQVMEFHTSRCMLDNRKNLEYRDYVRSIYDEQTLITDIASRGFRYFKFINGLDLKLNIYVISTTERMSVLAPHQYTVKSPYIPNQINTFEILNYDLVGSMASFANGQVIRKKVEYDCDTVKAGHECIELGLSMINNSICDPIFAVKSKIIIYMMELFKQSILPRFINHEIFHHSKLKIKLI